MAAKKKGKSVTKTVTTTTTTESKKAAPKKRKTSRKKTSYKKASPESAPVPKALIENFVALQKVLADLSIKLNDLNNQTSRLLTLFEDSAKAFTDKDSKLTLGSDKEVSEKLNKLLDQNKVLAQGIALLHEAGQQPEEEPQHQQFQEPPPVAPDRQMQGHGAMNNYQRSITSKY